MAFIWNDLVHQKRRYDILKSAAMFCSVKRMGERCVKPIAKEHKRAGAHPESTPDAKARLAKPKRH